MDNLARYYTEDIISNLLIQNISFINPRIIMDLGIGSGSLTKNAYKKWTNAKYYATDIDKNQLNKVSKKLNNVTILEANGLNINLEKKFKFILGNVDVAICNPPYLKIKSNQLKYIDLFKTVGLDNCIKLKYLTSDLVFLAQNLLFLREGGELGIILPDGLISSKEFKLFRNDIIKNHTIVSIIQLPDKVFKKTEAKTHILILKKGNKNSSNIVKLFLSDRIGNLIDYIDVPCNSLLERMDFYYHKVNLQKSNYTKSFLTLADIGAEIKRGNLTHKYLKESNLNFIHTTTLIHKSKIDLTDDIQEQQKNYLSTQGNDILLARVGRGCMGKISMVLGGSQLISDCVYRIRVPKRYLNKVWNSLCSDEGQSWLHSYSRGICARIISKGDLLSFPLLDK